MLASSRAQYLMSLRQQKWAYWIFAISARLPSDLQISVKISFLCFSFPNWIAAWTTRLASCWSAISFTFPWISVITLSIRSSVSFFVFVLSLNLFHNVFASATESACLRVDWRSFLTCRFSALLDNPSLFSSILFCFFLKFLSYGCLSPALLGVFRFTLSFSLAAMMIVLLP